MNKSIIEQLFFGEIYPSEHIGNGSPEHQKAHRIDLSKIGIWNM